MEIGAGGGPPASGRGGREHVEGADGEGATINDADDATELVLNHGEVGLEANERSVAGIALLRPGCWDGEEDEEREDGRH